MDLCLEGMDYFYRYDEFRLKMCITLAYIGWGGILVVWLLQRSHQLSASKKKKRRTKFHTIDQIAFVLSVLVFVVLTGKTSLPPFPFS